MKMGQRYPIPGSVALVPAAGMGSRLGLGPKGLLEAGGRPLVLWVVETLERIVGRIVVGAPREYLSDFSGVLGGRASVKAGGATRQETVRILAEGVKEDWILIHDAARPFASESLCRRVLEAARGTGAARSFP
jgi:2-C-methyl-D-erythritol 4-phosphate cytidylyltransferase